MTPHYSEQPSSSPSSSLPPWPYWEASIGSYDAQDRPINIQHPQAAMLELIIRLVWAALAVLCVIGTTAIPIIAAYIYAEGPRWIANSPAVVISAGTLFIAGTTATCLATCFALENR